MWPFYRFKYIIIFVLVIVLLGMGGCQLTLWVHGRNADLHLHFEEQPFIVTPQFQRTSWTIRGYWGSWDRYFEWRFRVVFKLHCSRHLQAEAIHARPRAELRPVPEPVRATTTEDRSSAAECTHHTRCWLIQTVCITYIYIEHRPGRCQHRAPARSSSVTRTYDTSRYCCSMLKWG